MSLPAIGIRPRILILGVATLALLAMLVFGVYRRGLEVLRESAEETIRGQAAAIAAEFDRGTLEALTAARGMALAAAEGLVQDRGSLEELAHERGMGNQGWSKGRTWRKMGSIPNLEIERILREEGINLIQNTPETQKRIRRYFTDNPKLSTKF